LNEGQRVPLQTGEENTNGWHLTTRHDRKAQSGLQGNSPTQVDAGTLTISLSWGNLLQGLATRQHQRFPLRLGPSRMYDARKSVLGNVGEAGNGLGEVGFAHDSWEIGSHLC
jgi:hypothetical protein